MREISLYQCDRCGEVFLNKGECKLHEERAHLVYCDECKFCEARQNRYDKNKWHHVCTVGAADGYDSPMIDNYGAHDCVGYKPKKKQVRR